MVNLKNLLRVGLLTLLLPSVSFAQEFVRLQPKHVVGTIDASGDSVVLSSTYVGGFGSVKVQTLDSYTGTWEVQCSANGTTYDADAELKLIPADSSSAITEVIDSVGIWDVANAGGCRSIRVIATAGFAGSDTAVVISATQAGGGGGAGGGAGGSVSITQGGNTAAVNASSQLSVTCANCTGTGVSLVDNTAFVGSTNPTTPAGALYDTTPPSITDGNAGIFRMDSDRILWTKLFTSIPAGTNNIGDVDVLTLPELPAGTNNIGDVDVLSVIPGTGATNLGKAIDSVAGATDTGIAPLAIRDDALSALTPVEGDWVPLRVDSTGALHVTASGLVGGGGTEFAEDTVHTTGELGNMPLAVRNDAGTALAADQDYIPLTTNASGSLRTIDGNSAALLTSVQLTDNIVSVEDAVAGSAFSGVGMLAVRQDAHSDLAADGDFIPMTVDADGGLRVSIVAGSSAGPTDTDDGTVAGAQSAGLNINLNYAWNGSAWVRSAPATTTEATHDAALTPGTTVSGLAMFRSSAAEPTNVSADDEAVLGWALRSGASVGTLVDSTGDFMTDDTNNSLRASVVASAGNGADAFSVISAGTAEDEHAVKASAGTLYSITATNTNAAVRYLKCENDTAANTAPGTDTPELRIAIPGNSAGSGFTTTFPTGYTFSNALTCWLVTGPTDADVTEVAANEIMVFYTFK